MGIEVKSSGSFDNLERFLKRAQKRDYLRVLEKYGQKGVDALARNTPRDSGKTASSWSYHISKGKSWYELTWTNSNINKGVNIAVIIQYGHGTGWGGYVAGRDYINPSLRPIFDQIANEVWKELTR